MVTEGFVRDHMLSMYIPPSDQKKSRHSVTIGAWMCALSLVCVFYVFVIHVTWVLLRLLIPTSFTCVIVCVGNEGLRDIPCVRDIPNYSCEGFVWEHLRPG